MMKSGRGTKEAADDRKAGKRKAAPAAVEDKGPKQKARKEKAKKDPNKPKRPPTAFFVFLEEFRKTFKKENPNANAVSAVAKAGGQKWRQMSAAEKAPYEAKAGQKKDEYGLLMNTYNNKKESNEVHGDEDSDKSKSEVNDDDEEDEEEEAPVAKEAPQVEQEEEVDEQEEEDDEDDDEEDEDEDDEE